MEFDWINPSYDLSKVGPREVEEAFEDPFCLKILPDLESEDSTNARYYLLGKTVENKGLFCCFWTNGKQYRVVSARAMSEVEDSFYERIKADRI